MWSIRLIGVIFATFSIFSVEGNDITLLKKNKRVSIQKLVYGGSIYKITEAPYMALYHMSGISFCGACIVHERFLLTAAHCYFANYMYYVEVGTDKIDDGIKYDVEKTIVHPRYKYIGAEANNDIAVVKLKTKLKFNERVNLINMAPKNIVIKSGAMMETMGFGLTENLETSRYLLKVKIPYISQYECRSMLNMWNITDSMICAGGFKGKDSCKGDSGGPLVYNNMLVGLVSFGGRCGQELPAVYASIPALRNFVDKTIRRESFKDSHHYNSVNTFKRPRYATGGSWW